MKDEFPEIQVRPGYDSPEIAPQLGEYGKLSEVKAWLSPNRKFSQEVVSQVLNSRYDDFDIDMLRVRGEDPDSAINKSMRNLCAFAVKDYKGDPNGTFGSLLENMREIWLEEAIKNQENVEILMEANFQLEVTDGVVVETVLDYFYGLLDSKNGE